MTMEISKDQINQEHSASGLLIQSIPGSYGIPFFSIIIDRLNFYYFQGHMAYFKSHITKHNSTVVRLNVPPGPFISSDSRVVALLDAVSSRVLLDSSKVEKNNTFTGTYVPSLSLYSGIRPSGFLDTTDPLHTSLKTLYLRLLVSRKMHFIPCFREVYYSVFDQIDKGLSSSGPIEFDKLNDTAAFDYACRALFGCALPSVSIGPSAADKASKWILFQLHPLLSNLSSLPWLLEHLLLHNFRLPPFLVRSEYKLLEAYFSDASKSVLDQAEQLGISRHVALHNIIFFTTVNAFLGFKIMFALILKRLAQAGPILHDKLRQEVRSVVHSDKGSVTPSNLENMHLVKSFVSEVLRLNPPLEYQYGRARTDLIIESHDRAYKVKKGEMLFGFLPIAGRDEKVFTNGEEFIPNRFVGEEGQKLLKYVYWSNGMENAEPGANDKQCAGKDVALLLGRTFVAELFLRYDTFIADVGALPESKIMFKSVMKASAN
ncbi:hypothetical protein LUZ60_012368 [Juncus effusus]|nr:hypothetical protein LUZ60_012368 [Juncus effusus]